jgi:3'-phosphoadenosine 5'-phosphosulfate sulfotransferase (PAPS reductase)/FAD synthetase
LEAYQLRQRQSLPLEAKIVLSQQRIKSWYDYWRGEVYISFSGGKDSTVLLDLVRQVHPNAPAVFLDTGLEYPEIRDFVKTIDNVIWIKPKMQFKDVIEHYGYPVVSKENAQKIHEIQTTKSEKLREKRIHGDDKSNGKLPSKWLYLLDAPFKISDRCCYALKKNPVKKYEKESGKKPIVGTMASDSRLRGTNYLKNGCNAFETKRPMSAPIAFWLYVLYVWGTFRKRTKQIPKNVRNTS